MRRAAALLWFVCATAVAQTAGDRAHALFDAYWEWQLRDSPRLATAIRYLADNSGITDASAVAEIDRYYVLPGQALAYKVGELKIKALRAKAEAALGERFDIRRFHNALIADGPLPLSVLEQRIDEWIARNRG